VFAGCAARFALRFGLWPQRASRARAQARMLVDQAIAHLAAFGAEADLLRAIARYVVERDR